jgi:hypothetical protein
MREHDPVFYLRRAKRDELLRLPGVTPDILEPRVNFELLCAFNADLNPDPKPPPEVCDCLGHDERANTLAERAHAGFALWNPADLIYQITTPEIDQAYQQIYDGLLAEQEQDEQDL